jgi:MHS family proline/betaine transporter-like MFS transporter
MKKVVIAGMIANTLEWYDFALYGHFALILSKHFFPASDPYIGLLATYSIFAAGFIMRPIGGIFFGYLGDKYGRKTTLAISILMMALPTAAIGLLPTYAKIGVWAPILLCLIRLIQGASIGGGFSGCIAFLVEYAPKKQRGLVGSVSMMSLSGGMLLGSLVSVGVAKTMSVAAFEEWGWRIPFLLGIVVSLVGVYVKVALHESPVYLKAKESNDLSSQPVREVLTHHSKPLLVGIGLYLTVCVPFYMLTLFMKSYMTGSLGFTSVETLRVNLWSLAVATMAIPVGAYVSDIYGRRPVLKYTAMVIMLVAYPFLWLLNNTSMEVVLFSQVVFAALVGFYMGPIPAVLVELFPTRVRFTGVSASYNLSVAAFGGTAPLVGTWLVNHARHDSIALYIVFFTVMTLFTIRYFSETYRNSIA